MVGSPRRDYYAKTDMGPIGIMFDGLLNPAWRGMGCNFEEIAPGVLGLYAVTVPRTQPYARPSFPFERNFVINVDQSGMGAYQPPAPTLMVPTLPTLSQWIPSGANKIELPEVPGKPVKSAAVLGEWSRFLGAGPITDIHPRLGTHDRNRLVARIGDYEWRSIRFGSHEVKYSHYHEEVWIYNPSTRMVTIYNTYRKIID